MKILFDFFPILLFFVAYKVYDFKVATVVAMVAALVQVGAYWLKYRRVENIYLISLVLIVVLGGATLLLDNELIFKWKPTVVNWLFAVAFLGSQFIGKKTVVERLMGANIQLDPFVWTRLNLSWVAFFTAIGIANLYVAYHFETDIWVDFKLFGMLGLTVLFVIAQGFYLSRHIKPEPVEIGKDER
ncbi:MAG: septation protein A [Gammaproteobacteria bacterium RBG_16_57_12]|nr:MAG: septation protein A [Gammaproteobacteria bacterium RBG_16_57_12]